MADNVAITAGSGTTVSTEEVTTLNGGVVTAQHVQRVGLAMVTGDGTAVDVKTANPIPVTPAAAEVHLGEVGSPADVIAVTLTLDTSAYAAGDVLADTQQVANVMRVNDGHAILQTIHITDEDSQSQPFDLVFFSANIALGTENGAPSISDANASANILAVVPVVAADYSAIGGVTVATLRNVGVVLEAATGTKDVYMGAVTRGTPTHTASGVKIRLGVLQN